MATKPKTNEEIMKSLHPKLADLHLIPKATWELMDAAREAGRQEVHRLSECNHLLEECGVCRAFVDGKVEVRLKEAEQRVAREILLKINGTVDWMDLRIWIKERYEVK